MPRRGTPDSDASKDAVVYGNNSAFPEAVPVTQDEEPEMQAQPGIFTNQRGNLKVRACVTSRLRAPLHASVPAYSSLNSPESYVRVCHRESVTGAANRHALRLTP